MRSESRLNLKYKTQLDGSKILSRICRTLNLDRNECVEVLLRIYRQKNSPRWIENLSRSYRQKKCLEILLDGSKKLSRIYREEIQKSQWIKNLSRFLSRLKKESSIEMNLLGICQEAIELKENEFFKGGKTHRYECNK